MYIKDMPVRHAPLSLVVFFALAVVATRVPVLADAVPGHVIVVRTSEDALIIWDSTPEVAAIVKNKDTDSDANARLERDALMVLATSIDKVKSSKTVTIRVVYNKTSDVSPVYGTGTFAGVERYANLSASTTFAANHKREIEGQDSGSVIPTWIRFTVVGSLPARP